MPPNPAYEEGTSRDDLDHTWTLFKRAETVRWTFLDLLIAFAILILPMAYFHALWRDYKGRPLLRYHRWLFCLCGKKPEHVSLYGQTPTDQNQTSSPNLTGLYNPVYRTNPSIVDTLNMFEIIPPAYNPNALRPPSYMSPPPSFKTEASIRRSELLESNSDVVPVLEQAGSGEPAEAGNTISSEIPTTGRQLEAAPESRDVDFEGPTRIPGTTSGTRWP